MQETTRKAAVSDQGETVTWASVATMTEVKRFGIWWEEGEEAVFLA